MTIAKISLIVSLIKNKLRIRDISGKQTSPFCQRRFILGETSIIFTKQNNLRLKARFISDTGY